MTIPRIYFPENIHINTAITLPHATSHHLLHVLRLHVSDKLLLFNGQGGEYHAELHAINKKQAIVIPLRQQQGIRESTIKIHIGQGIICGSKMDYIIQKAVELGVHCITPLFTQFCNVKLSGERLMQRCEHWQKIAIHASEQCGRSYVPQIAMAQSLPQWLATLPEAAVMKITLTPEATTSLTTLPHTSTCAATNATAANATNATAAANATTAIAITAALAPAIHILIGAEGGLSQEEIALTQQHAFVPCHLGPRILRADTVALAALSILQNRYGDMQ